MRFILIIIFSLLALNAEAANIYEIKNVTATANNPDETKGREQVMANVQAQAFEELENRLVSNKYITQKQKLSQARINTAVDSIDVVDEKPTAKSFKGTYNITFSAYEVSKIFNIKAIAQTKEPEKFLVIPIVAEDDEIKLWKNDWWPVWNEFNHDPIFLPLADLEDIQNLKVEDLAAHHLAGLNKIAERYGANVIVLLQAQYDDNAQSLDVQLEKIKGKEKTVINYEYPSNPKVKPEELYQAAAKDLAYRLQNNKLTADDLTTVLDEDAQTPPPAAKEVPEPYSPDAPGAGFLGQRHASSEPPLPASESEPEVKPVAKPVTKPAAKSKSNAVMPAKAGANTSEAVVAAPDLAAWQRVRAKLMAIPGLTLKTNSLSSGRAYITLSYNTDIESLKKSLAAQGLVAINSGTNLAIKEK